MPGVYPALGIAQILLLQANFELGLYSSIRVM